MSRGPIPRRPAAALALAAALLAGEALAPGGTARLGAEATARVLESVLLPPRFFVGDPVELRLRVAVPAGVTVAAPEAGDLPAGDRPPGDPFEPGREPGTWVRIDRVEVLDRRRGEGEGEVQLRVFFSSFAPGEGRLPELDLGGVRLPPQEFTTASVREREADPGFRPLREQLLLPFTGLRLALSVLVVAGTPAVLILLGLWTARLLGRLRELRRRRRPAQRARSALHKLAQGLDQAETKEVFVDLSEVLKRYLAERLQVPTASATTAEIDGLLGGVGVTPALSGRVLEVLRTADTVKFSGRTGRRRAARSSLEKVQEIVSGVEELCDVES